MEQFGYHEGYKYPHDYPNHYVEQQYLPDEMLGKKYYVKDDTVSWYKDKLNKYKNKL